MNNMQIIKLCKDLGCCDACCLRYIGLKNPSAFESSRKYVQNYLEPDSSVKKADKIEQNAQPDEAEAESAPVSAEHEVNDVPAKKRKTHAVCVSCIGVLQEQTWPECLTMVKQTIDKKHYECESFACALSAPISTILREKAVSLCLAEALTHYDENVVTPLKEAWKWSFGGALAAHVGKALDSGAVAPLLVTLHLEYADDLQELEVLKHVSPDVFAARAAQRRRFGAGVTRRAAEDALQRATLARLAAAPGWARAPPPPALPVRCVSVAAAHEPLYLGGRYIKLSRALPQTPWVLHGERMMDSSVQEIIFEPIAKLYEISPEAAEHRLKFMSAGREDVDVRCLGDGRPFAIEVSDPRREPTAEELVQICEQISKSGKVVVKKIVTVSRDKLAELKKGEETKSKTYEALCIKLSHSEDDIAEGATAATAVRVTARDLANVERWCAESGGAIEQRTPVRVLHRRPLLARRRRVLRLHAARVPGAGREALLALRVLTDAGTYVKEWAHGEARRTRPALAQALRARADILALDVAAVHLAWP